MMRGTSVMPGGSTSVTAAMSLKEVDMILVLAAAAAAASPVADADIVVTGSRRPLPEAESPVSAASFDRERLDQLGLPMAADALRLSPGVSIASTGPRGTQTQLRIRGAEANHSLLFVDGIKFNDPAAGNEARFELLASDGLSRLELVRGPQSALWGSEALGGVVAVESGDGRQSRGVTALGEYGGLDSSRASARFGALAGDLALGGGAVWVRSDGIDSFGGGDRDGFDNKSASLKAVLTPAPTLEIGLVGHWIRARNDYDGLDPFSFRRADTPDTTVNRIGAIGGWAKAKVARLEIKAEASLLDSVNRNFLAGAPINSSFGRRLSADLQASFTSGGHELIAAAHHEKEDFRARDPSFMGIRDQDRSRRLNALVGEWRARWAPFLSTDVAVRRDWFSAFADSTTVRATAIATPATGLRVHIAYGEGIAQPSFYDLFGFFPGTFTGNPGLKPESSTGWEAGVRFQRGRTRLAITGFSNRLSDEIVGTFDPATSLAGTANASSTSRRRGLELEAEHRFSGAFSLAFNYSFLDADEQVVSGGPVLKEVRRPRHSFNMIAGGTAGALTWGAAAAWVGRRTDSDFDLFPAPTVVLDDYLLASLNVAYRLDRRIEAYVRAENALGADYQDVVGYRTAGRTVHAGLRISLGD
jgi:vitamin B12 transporter